MNNFKALKLQRQYKSFFDNISYLEDFIIGNNKKKKNSINKHVFVAGMPRSGTTILTHILSNFFNVGTYNYSDLPFFKFPYLWSKLNRFYYVKNKKINRPHGDGMKIDISSPDAFEELVWSENLENYFSNGFSKYLDEGYDNQVLQSELIRNINKILILRKKKIYLSKGNYNIFRIKFIKKILPNSLFIICIRNPYDVINSSIQTHKNFIEESKKNKFFDLEMRELCHFEFGNNRVNIRDQQNDFNDFDYYKNQWKEIHDLININYLNLKNVFLFNFDNFLKDPQNSIYNLSKKINFNYDEKVKNFIELNVKKRIINLSNINDSKIDLLHRKLIEKSIN